MHDMSCLLPEVDPEAACAATLDVALAVTSIQNEFALLKKIVQRFAPQALQRQTPTRIGFVHHVTSSDGSRSTRLTMPTSSSVNLVTAIDDLVQYPAGYEQAYYALQTAQTMLDKSTRMGVPRVIILLAGPGHDSRFSSDKFKAAVEFARAGKIRVATFALGPFDSPALRAAASAPHFSHRLMAVGDAKDKPGFPLNVTRALLPLVDSICADAVGACLHVAACDQRVAVDVRVRGIPLGGGLLHQPPATAGTVGIGVLQQQPMCRIDQMSFSQTVLRSVTSNATYFRSGVLRCESRDSYSTMLASGIRSISVAVSADGTGWTRAHSFTLPDCAGSVSDAVRETRLPLPPPALAPQRYMGGMLCLALLALACGLLCDTRMQRRPEPNRATDSTARRSTFLPTSAAIVFAAVAAAMALDGSSLPTGSLVCAGFICCTSFAWVTGLVTMDMVTQAYAFGVTAGPLLLGAARFAVVLPLDRIIAQLEAWPSPEMTFTGSGMEMTRLVLAATGAIGDAVLDRSQAWKFKLFAAYLSCTLVETTILLMRLPTGRASLAVNLGFQHTVLPLCGAGAAELLVLMFGMSLKLKLKLRSFSDRLCTTRTVPDEKLTATIERVRGAGDVQADGVAHSLDEEDEEDNTCIVCMDAKKDATLVHGEEGQYAAQRSNEPSASPIPFSRSRDAPSDISHLAPSGLPRSLCCCFDCARSLQTKGAVCPVCRRPIDAIIRTFL